MAKTCTLHVRMEPELKEEAERILAELGITPAEAITIFYKQICIRKAMPFEITLSNKQKKEVQPIKKKSLSGILEKYADASLKKMEDRIWDGEANE